MTDSTSINADEPEPAPFEYTNTRRIDVDDTLQLLASLAQKHEVEMSVTLNVAGAIVSGTLIGRDKWAALLADQVKVATGTGTESMSEILMDWLTARPDQGDPEDLNSHNYGFVHLRNAVLYPGNQPLPSHPRTVLWRGRISEVSGWTLGSFAPS